jgi:hypothetical protein
MKLSLRACFALLALALAGCTPVRHLVLEARCGFGKDFVCGPTSPTGPIVCGCVEKHWTDRRTRP